MLRSFANHFNETVFRGPENEGGSDLAPSDTNDTVLVDDGGASDDTGDPSDGGDGQTEGEAQKPLSVREQLKKSIAEVNADNEREAKAKPRKDGKTGRFQSAAPADPTAPQEQPQAPAGPAITAPDSLTKEAKAEWDKAPRAIQEAFVKREQDMAAGVNELKQKYSLIDEALAPHNDALRQMNATPGEAVNRLFLWFKALAGSPVQAFPSLAKSMGYDWGKVVQAIQGGAQPQAPAAGQEAVPEIPAPVQQYVGRLEQQINNLQQQLGQVGSRFDSVQQDLNAQNEAKTRENLSIWSSGKEFYEDVRKDMAALIQTGMIPLKNGQVDLDTAYERAIYYNPDVRAKVLAKQQQANQQVQQTSEAATAAQKQGQVARARKAGVSLPASTTPGSGNGAIAQKKPGQKLSVKDSLKEAIAQLRDQ